MVLRDIHIEDLFSVWKWSNSTVERENIMLHPRWKVSKNTAEANIRNTATKSSVPGVTRISIPSTDILSNNTPLTVCFSIRSGLGWVIPVFRTEVISSDRGRSASYEGEAFYSPVGIRTGCSASNPSRFTTVITPLSTAFKFFGLVYWVNYNAVPIRGRRQWWGNRNGNDHLE